MPFPSFAFRMAYILERRRKEEERKYEAEIVAAHAASSVLDGLLLQYDLRTGLFMHTAILSSKRLTR